MKITIIGTGYVGLVTGACLADVGNDVHCIDLLQSKIDMLNQGGIPIHEPGLDEIVARNLAAGRLHFSTDIASGVAHGEILFVAVGTPPDEDGSADLQYVLGAVKTIGRLMSSFKVIVNKSTVPVGTGLRVQEAIQQELDLREARTKFSVVSNPEFLKEGAAVEDFMHPDRIVIGCDNSQEGQRARTMMRHLYAPFHRDVDCVVWMDVRSAEFTKYAANAMLATRISFMNELALLSEKVGADIEAVRQGVGSDTRIGHSFLMAGCGYGGSCFPKDVQALVRTARDHGTELAILQAVEDVNHAQKQVLGQKIRQRFGADLAGKHFAMWGLAFKPNTDDMREAPARALLRTLLDAGASVCVYDPVAMDEAQRVLQLDFADTPAALTRIRFAATADEALNDAMALVIMTEWDAFRSPDFDAMKARLREPIIFDGRNLFEPELMAEAGFEYYGIGRALLNTMPGVGS
jgi:UDPglucose 6-dehydrogenase